MVDVPKDHFHAHGGYDRLHLSSRTALLSLHTRARLGNRRSGLRNLSQRLSHVAERLGLWVLLCTGQTSARFDH